MALTVAVDASTTAAISGIVYFACPIAVDIAGTGPFVVAALIVTTFTVVVNFVVAFSFAAAASSAEFVK